MRGAGGQLFKARARVGCRAIGGHVVEPTATRTATALVARGATPAPTHAMRGAGPPAAPSHALEEARLAAGTTSAVAGQAGGGRGRAPRTGVVQGGVKASGATRLATTTPRPVTSDPRRGAIIRVLAAAARRAGGGEGTPAPERHTRAAGGAAVAAAPGVAKGRGTGAARGITAITLGARPATRGSRGSAAIPGPTSSTAPARAIARGLWARRGVRLSCAAPGATRGAKVGGPRTG